MCRPMSHPFVPYIELAMVSLTMPKIEEKIRHTTGGDSSQNFPAWALKKENNKYLGGWGVEIQIFFWASHLIGGMGALI